MFSGILVFGYSRIWVFSLDQVIHQQTDEKRSEGGHDEGLSEGDKFADHGGLDMQVDHDTYQEEIGHQQNGYRIIFDDMNGLWVF